MNAEPDLPSWTSQAVAALGPAQAELLGRLTSEPRMKRVWREFGRRRRSDGAPLYPVGAPKLLLMEVLKLTKERTLCAPITLMACTTPLMIKSQPRKMTTATEDNTG